MKNGYFITVEGGEGSGKTSAINSMKDFLEQRGFEVVVTREPGGIQVAEKIRDIVLFDEMDTVTEALLFTAARREHLVQKVVPALNSGKVVICDRFFHSSIVYQGIVGGLGIETIQDMNEKVVGTYVPDLTILMDVEPETGLARIKQNNRETNKIDNYDVAFHHQVREGYLSLTDMYSYMEVVNANMEQAEVLTRIEKILEKQLADRGE